MVVHAQSLVGLNLSAISRVPGKFAETNNIWSINLLVIYMAGPAGSLPLKLVMSFGQIPTKIRR